jgi:hypothetical protein
MRLAVRSAHAAAALCDATASKYAPDVRALEPLSARSAADSSHEPPSSRTRACGAFFRLCVREQKRLPSKCCRNKITALKGPATWVKQSGRQRVPVQARHSARGLPSCRQGVRGDQMRQSLVGIRDDGSTGFYFRLSGPTLRDWSRHLGGRYITDPKLSQICPQATCFDFGQWRALGSLSAMSAADSFSVNF